MAVPLLGAVMVAAGCSGSGAEVASTTVAPPTLAAPETTLSPADAAAAEYEADVELIADLWWGQNLAWSDGFDSGIQYWVDHNYPPMGCTFEDYMTARYPEGPVSGLQVERVVNEPTIQRDDGWVIPGGRLAGEVAEGRIYEMTVRENRIDDVNGAREATLDLHVTVIDGKAHFFLGCS